MPRGYGGATKKVLDRRIAADEIGRPGRDQQVTDRAQSIGSQAQAADVVGRGHQATAGADELVWVGSHARATQDVQAGADAAMAAITGALREERWSVEDLVRVGVYFEQGLEDAEVRRAIRAALPDAARPVINLLPVREPALPGAAVVVDAAAARGPRATVGDADFPMAVRVGDRIWVGGLRGTGAGILAQTGDVIAGLRSTATEAGAALDDCVKMNISYVGDGTEADWEPTAKLRAEAFREPAAAATGIPYPRLAGDALTQFETLSVAGSTGIRRHGWPEGHWDWPIHLPWKHACRAGDLVTIGGQVSLRGRGEVVDPGDLGAQTATALANIERALRTVDARMSDVTQVTAFFEGSPNDLETILTQTRTAFGERPPPIVPVPLPFLAYREMVVEIEVIAMARSPLGDRGYDTASP
jgi:enamine deaminase RidA (YjgF/YER057c/UK114 family)